MIQVKLKETSNCIASIRNPKIGSKFETVGTLFKLCVYRNNSEIEIVLNNIEQLNNIQLPIINTKEFCYCVLVNWGDFIINMYTLKDLIILNNINYKSIW